MKFKKVSQKTVVKVLRAYADFLDSADASQLDRLQAAAFLDEHLDDMYEADAFGTEGQLDPRGDHRG